MTKYVVHCIYIAKVYSASRLELPAQDWLALGLWARGQDKTSWREYIYLMANAEKKWMWVQVLVPCKCTFSVA